MSRLWARLELCWRILTGSSSYVVIYDREEVLGVETEEYYGYFSGPEEAREMYGTAFGADADIIEGRTKLCLVLEDWN